MPNLWQRSVGDAAFVAGPVKAAPLKELFKTRIKEQKKGLLKYPSHGAWRSISGGFISRLCADPSAGFLASDLAEPLNMPGFISWLGARNRVTGSPGAEYVGFYLVALPRFTACGALSGHAPCG